MISLCKSRAQGNDKAKAAGQGNSQDKGDSQGKGKAVGQGNSQDKGNNKDKGRAAGQGESSIFSGVETSRKRLLLAFGFPEFPKSKV